MNLLIAPLELKGTLTAREAAAVMAGVFPEAQVLPLADGGPGTADCVPSNAGLHVVESAKAIGLTRVPPDERRPLDVTSRGVGELISNALDAGARRIAVTVGGTGTVDLGLGCAQALGAVCRDSAGAPVEPSPKSFSRIAAIDTSGLDPRLASVELEAWLDVWAPLCGPAGAVFRYGGQKGLQQTDMPWLDAQFARLGGHTRADGDGAGGGLGWALRALLGARVRSGFEAVADAVHLDDALSGADIVLTAEGRFDAQSLQGKGPWALAQRAPGRVIVFCGACEVPQDTWNGVLRDVIELGPPGENPSETLRKAVLQTARNLRG